MKSPLEQRIEVIREKTAKAFVPILDADLPLNIKEKAVVILSKTGAQVARDKINEFFQLNPNSEEGIVAYARIMGEDAVPALIERLKNRKCFHRDVIAEQLGMYKSPTVHDCLKEMLADSNRHVRFQAASSLYSIGGRDSALALCRYISDPDEWISMSILRLLCLLKEHESIPYLAEQFSRDPDLRRKAIMVSFLSRFRSVTLVNMFDEGIRGRDARLKANSIEAIGELELPEREIKNRIEPFLRDPNNRIRANSILALARSEPEKIRPEIVNMALSSDIQLRRSAAFILGIIKISDNEGLAEKLLLDTSDDVRKRMVLSLKSFPAEFQRNQLQKTVMDKNKWIRKFSIDIASNLAEFPKELIYKQFRAENAYPNLVACMNFFIKHPSDEAIRLAKTRVKDKRVQVVDGVIRTIAGVTGLRGLQALAPQIDYRIPLILQSFVVNHFQLAGIEIFDSILEKATTIKKGYSPLSYFPSIDGCLDVLGKGAMMPKPLHDLLSRPMAPVAPPPVQQVATPIPIQPTVDAAHAVAQPRVALVGADKSTAKVAAPTSGKAAVPPKYSVAIKSYNLGKYAKATRLLRELSISNPELDKVRYFLGMIAYERKDFEEARNNLSAFLAKNPRNKKTLQILGKLFQKLRDWPNVIEVFEKIVTGKLVASPKHLVKALNELGMAYIFVGNYSRAKEILEKAFQKEPTNCENNYYLAMAYFRLNNFVRAESLLADIVQRVEPGNKLRIMADSMLDQIRDKLDNALEPSSEFREDYSDQPKDSPAEDFGSGEDEDSSDDESSAEDAEGDEFNSSDGDSAGSEDDADDLLDLSFDDSATAETEAPPVLPLSFQGIQELAEKPAKKKKPKAEPDDEPLGLGLFSGLKEEEDADDDPDDRDDGFSLPSI